MSEPQLNDLAGKTLTAGNRRFRASLSRSYLVVPITVTTVSSTDISGSTVFQAPRNVIVEKMTAWCSDASGLAAFRLGWFNEAGKQLDFYATENATEPVYPIGSTFLTDAGIYRIDNLNLIFLRDGKRTFKAINNVGTAPYTVELTLHLRELDDA